MVIKLKLLFNTEVLTFELKRQLDISPFRADTFKVGRNASAK